MLLSIYFEGPPTGVMAEAVGADGVHVTWEQPPARYCRIGFRVSYTPERGGRTLSTGVGSFSATDYTVLGLHCNTVYIFTVGSIAQDGMTVTWSEGVRALAGGDYSLHHILIAGYHYHCLSSRSQEFLCNSSIIHFSLSDLGASCKSLQ